MTLVHLNTKGHDHNAKKKKKESRKIFNKHRAPYRRRKWKPKLIITDSFQLISWQNIINQEHRPNSADNAFSISETILLRFGGPGVENESDDPHFNYLDIKRCHYQRSVSQTNVCDRHANVEVKVTLVMINSRSAAQWSAAFEQKSQLMLFDFYINDV